MSEAASTLSPAAASALATAAAIEAEAASIDAATATTVAAASVDTTTGATAGGASAAAPEMASPVTIAAAAVAAAQVEIDLSAASAKAAADYAQFLRFENLGEITAVATNVDDMLKKLDEMRSLSETLHRDSLVTIQTHLPYLMKNTAKLQGLFAYIEQVEKYINHIKGFVSRLEERLDQAEKDFQSRSIKKVFDGFKLPSLFGKKSMEVPVAAPPGRFHPVEVFATEDYFPARESDVVAESE